METRTETFDAFISYRQTEPDRWWAKWLHEGLESYRTPGDLVKQKGVRPRLSKVFRDEDEFAATSDLTREVQTALEQSRFLIVVCSPRSAASKWVNAEVQRFAELGRADNILALLIEGEPDAAFPPTLINLRPVRLPNDQSPDPSHVQGRLAADVRPEIPGGIRRKRRLAKLRLLAVLLGCGFDDLRKRERERRRRRMALVVSGFTVLTAAILAMWWGLELQSKYRLETQRRSQLAAQAEEQGRRALMAGDQLRAARYLEDAYSELRREPTFQLLLNAAFDKCEGLVYVLRGHKGKIRDIEIHPASNLLVSASDDGAGRIWKLQNGQLLRLLGKDGDSFIPIQAIDISRDARRALFISGSEAFICDLQTGNRVNLKLPPGDSPVMTARLSEDGLRVIGSILNYDETTFQTRLTVWNRENGLELTNVHIQGNFAVIGVNSSGQRAIIVGDPDASMKLNLAAKTRTVLSVDAETGAISSNILVGAFDDVRPSPDAERLLVAQRTGIAAVYDSVSTNRLFVLDSGGAIMNAYWSPSGKLIRSIGHDGLTIWDGMTGARIRRWDNIAYSAATIDRSDRFLATANDNGEINIWDIHSGALLQVIQDCIGWSEPHAVYLAVDCLRFSADGKLLIFAGNSPLIKAWDWMACKPIRISVGTSENDVTTATLSLDGAIVATGDRSGAVHIWSSETGQLIPTSLSLRPQKKAPESSLGGTEKIDSVAFMATGKRLVTVSIGSDAKLWDAATGQLLKTLEFDKQALVLGDKVRIAVSPAGDRFLTLSGVGRGVFWDANRLEQQKYFTLSKLVPNGDVKFSSDGTKVIAGAGDGSISVIDPRTGDTIRLLGPLPQAIVSVEISPDGKTALAVDEGGAAAVWDVSTGNLVVTLNKDGPRLNEIHFSGDSKLVLAAGGDSSVHVWNITSGKEELVLTEEKVGGEQFDVPAPIDTAPGTIVRTGFICANYSPDGRLVAGGNEFGRIAVWDAKTGKQLLKLTGHAGRIVFLGFSRDGNRLLSRGEDGRVFLWAIPTSDTGIVLEKNIQRLISSSE